MDFYAVVDNDWRLQVHYCPEQTGWRCTAWRSRGVEHILLVLWFWGWGHQRIQSDVPQEFNTQVTGPPGDTFSNNLSFSVSSSYSSQSLSSGSEPALQTNGGWRLGEGVGPGQIRPVYMKDRK